MSLTLWPPASFLVTAPGFSRRVVETSVQSLEGCNPCGLWTRSAAHSAMPVSPFRKIGYVGARVPSKAEAARRWRRTSPPTPDSRLREEPKANVAGSRQRRHIVGRVEERKFTRNQDTVVVSYVANLCNKGLVSCQIVDGGLGRLRSSDYYCSSMRS